jgi:Uma2 family endonuclease
MSVTTLISVEEYLRTSYQDGDREYIDGRVVERNLGTISHAHWQTRMVISLSINYPKLWAAVEVRVQVKPTRFRVPDVTCIWGSTPEGSIIHEPPFLVIEVLSPDDRAEDVQDKVDDYLSFGIQYVWVVNPRTRRGYLYTTEGMREAKDGVLRTGNPEIALPLNEIL